ncbi:hypothetical protein FQN57_003183 [Myotisia sp. PD_48]|nr:hypothetical protein FQN57_003183 [Myotisia sp. PD_48]
MATQITKRLRDESEVEDEFNRSFFHGNKKPRPLLHLGSIYVNNTEPAQHILPLVTPAIPRTLTPAESSDDETHISPFMCSDSTQPVHFSPPWADFRSRTDPDPDSDLEMADSQSMISNSRTPWSDGLSPAYYSSLAHSPISSHRVNEALNVSKVHAATPTYGRFDSGSSIDIAMGGRSLSLTVASKPLVQQGNPSIDGPGHCGRRPPSPISEDGLGTSHSHSLCLNTSTGLLSGADIGHTINLLQPSPTKNTPNMGLITTEGVVNDPFPGETKQSEVGAHSSIPVTSKPRKKATLAMGFRADCEKCQRRVPGHYSHIVYS